MRIGDLLAGTWVVEAPDARWSRTCRAHEPGRRRVSASARQQLDAYGIAELHKLEEVLRGDDDGRCGRWPKRSRRKIGWTGDGATRGRS